MSTSLDLASGSTIHRRGPWQKIYANLTLISGKQDWKSLRVVVEPGPGSEMKDKVNIRVPAKLIRAGLKFAAFIPSHTQGPVQEALRQKGIDIDLTKITPEDLEDIVASLDDVTVEVEGKDRVRVFCE